METEIKALITKASLVASADEAMKFSQAALNSANAMRAMNDIKISDKK